MNEIEIKVKKAIKEWNSIADEPIGTRIHKLQIRAFILGKGEECSIEDIERFIAQELLD